MTRMLAATLLGLFLAGCTLTPQGDAFRGAVAETGRAAAAQGLENAEWYICRASPVGAVVDRYGASPERWANWSGICLNPSPAVSDVPPGFIEDPSIQIEPFE